MADNKRLDMTSGPVAKGLLAFALPIILGNLLQQLYGAADRLVVGQFAENGATALAAVGATSAPINLIIGLFTGLATGVNVICANLLGSRDTRQLRKSMHTAVVVGLLCGAALAGFGWIAAPVILSWMDTPESVMPLAIRYMRIYFVGVPASLLYNFLAGILRAHGDTKRPMYILMFSGLVNVALNLVFVIVFHMGVAGVAIATAVPSIWPQWRLCILCFRRRISTGFGCGSWASISASSCRSCGWESPAAWAESCSAFPM